MSQRFVRQAVTAAALAASLALGTPAHAAGLPEPGSMSLFEQVSHWLTSMWPGDGPILEKSGPGVDPDGSPVRPSTACTECDRGAGVDPDG